MTKVFKTHNQQLRILRGRGLCIGSNGTPKRILEKTNYYNLINGYKDLFLDPASIGAHERYRTNAGFMEIKALYDFDCELRGVLLRRILRVENTLKSEIAYEFSKNYGHDSYLKMDNFDLGTGSVGTIKPIIELLKSIQGDVARQVDKHDSIGHYMTRYGYIPLWVLVNILTLGTMSKFYSHMKQPDRQAISRKYGLADSELRKMLSVLTLYRNKCAHDERVYNFRTRESIKATRYHTLLAIQLGANGPVCGMNDVFALVICLRFLLARGDFRKMVLEIAAAIRTLGKCLKVVSVNDVLTQMGFPNNWADIKDL